MSDRNDGTEDRLRGSAVLAAMIFVCSGGCLCVTLITVFVRWVLAQP